MDKIKQEKQVFSISKKYQEVSDILKNVDNKSEFICQAIIEKIRGNKQIENDMEKHIEQTVRKILEEKLIVFPVNTMHPLNVVPVESTTFNKNSENSSSNEIVAEELLEVENVNEIDEEDAEYLKGVFDDM